MLIKKHIVLLHHRYLDNLISIWLISTVILCILFRAFKNIILRKSSWALPDTKEVHGPNKAKEAGVWPRVGLLPTWGLGGIQIQRNVFLQFSMRCSLSTSLLGGALLWAEPGHLHKKTKALCTGRGSPGWLQDRCEDSKVRQIKESLYLYSEEMGVRRGWSQVCRHQENSVKDWGWVFSDSVPHPTVQFITCAHLLRAGSWDRKRTLEQPRPPSPALGAQRCPERN